MDEVKLMATDLVRAKKFYLMSFGWIFGEETDNCIEITNSPTGVKGKIIKGEVKPDINNPVSFEVRSVESKTYSLKKNGGEIISQTTQNPTGRTATFKDSEGNIVEIHDRIKGNEIFEINQSKVDAKYK